MKGEQTNDRVTEDRGGRGTCPGKPSYSGSIAGLSTDEDDGPDVKRRISRATVRTHRMRQDRINATRPLVNCGETSATRPDDGR